MFKFKYVLFHFKDNSHRKARVTSNKSCTTNTKYCTRTLTNPSIWKKTDLTVTCMAIPQDWLSPLKPHNREP